MIAARHFITPFKLQYRRNTATGRTPSMQTITITRDGPLLETLAEVTKNRTQVKQWLKLRRILVNGETAQRHDQPLKPGDVVSIGPVQHTPVSVSPRGLRIVFEDDAILVIDKPAGLLTIATDSERAQTAYYKATEHVKQNSHDPGARVFIVHRLDRETSGLLVFAKTENAKQALQDQWNEVEKRYLAVVQGRLDQPSGTIESHLTETKAFQVFSGRQTQYSKHAVTHYTVLESGDGISLLEIRTATGRKHQIRVHLADLGHPIVGDDRYGKKSTASRLGLHASLLRFLHPTTGKTVEFKSPLPGPLGVEFKYGKTKPCKVKPEPKR
ncbi:MAG: RluA family pseudouridine synthase [Planctomycetaceae bacterium]|nr:RluA family pseudouridine synthase [Planctomycetaceae bacterium]